MLKLKVSKRILSVSPFVRVMRIGTTMIGNRWASIYVKAQYDAHRGLSVSGVMRPLSSGNALGGCGQIDIEFAHRNPKHNDPRCEPLIRPTDIRFAAGWTADKWLTLLEIWHDWHFTEDNKPVPEPILLEVSYFPETDRRPPWV